MVVAAKSGSAGSARQARPRSARSGPRRDRPDLEPPVELRAPATRARASPPSIGMRRGIDVAGGRADRRSDLRRAAVDQEPLTRRERGHLRRSRAIHSDGTRLSSTGSPMNSGLERCAAHQDLDRQVGDDRQHDQAPAARDVAVQQSRTAGRPRVDRRRMPRAGARAARSPPPGYACASARLREVVADRRPRRRDDQQRASRDRRRRAPPGRGSATARARSSSDEPERGGHQQRQRDVGQQVGGRAVVGVAEQADRVGGRAGERESAHRLSGGRPPARGGPAARPRPPTRRRRRRRPGPATSRAKP